VTKNMAPWHRKLGHGEAWAREVTSSLDGFFFAACQKKNQSRLGALAAGPDGFFFRSPAGRGRDWIFFSQPRPGRGRDGIFFSRPGVVTGFFFRRPVGEEA